jgi:hypothetical protein
MKKATLKKIEESVGRLPKIYEKRKIWKTVLGKDIKPEEATEIEGKPIDPEHTYYYQVEEEIEVNHIERAKDAYKRSGNEGVVKYAGDVTRQDLSNKRKQRQFDKKPGGMEKVFFNKKEAI